jgi:hypothetical protein
MLKIKDTHLKSWQAILEEIAVYASTSAVPLSEDDVNMAEGIYWSLCHKSQKSELVDLHYNLIKAKHAVDVAKSGFIDCGHLLEAYHARTKSNEKN